MKLSKPFFALLFALTFAALTWAQKTDKPLPAAKEVLAKFTELTGGAEAYKNVKSRIVSGKMEMKAAGVKGDLTTTTTSDGKFYTEVELEGLGTEKMGSDGTTYWSVSQFTGTRVLEGSERDMQAMENDLTSLLHPEKYYKSMKVTGVEKVDEKDCYVLEKIKKDGDKITEYYSVETGLMTKLMIPAMTPLGKINIEVFPSDYRKVGDLLVSHSSTQKLPGNMTQTITIEKVEVNTEVAEDKFALPEDVKKLMAKKAAKEAEKEAEAK